METTNSKRSIKKAIKALFVVDSQVSEIQKTDLISRIFFSRISPLVFGLSMLLLGLIVFILSLKLHVAHLALNGRGVGYLDRLNWGYTYVTVIPLLFFLGCKAHHKMANAIIVFYKERVIREISQTSNSELKLSDTSDFINDFIYLLRRHSVAIIVVTLLITIIFTISDTKEEWTELFKINIYVIDQADKEWFNAYAHWNENETKPSVLENVFFNIMAYTLQTLVVVFGIHLVTKFIFYIYTLMNIQKLSQKKLRSKIYKYHLIADNEVIGLKGLAVIFNIFLSILTAMGLYLALHRWQEMDDVTRNNWKQVGQCLNFNNLNLSKLIEPLKNEMWRSGADPDYAVILFLFLSILFVACYFPMRKWRSFLQNTLQQAESEHRTMLSDIQNLQEKEPDAKIKDRKNEADRLLSKIERLKKESVWPNGDKTAFAFLSVIAFTYLVGLYPAWSPVTLLVVIVIAYFTFYKGKWTK